MNTKQFASLIRGKHPGAYDDLDDETLTAKVIGKYPQYRDMLDAGSVNPADIALPGSGEGGEYPNETHTSSDNAQILQTAMGAPGLARGAVALGKGVINGVSEIAPLMGQGLKDAVETDPGDVVDSIKAAMPSPSIRGLGYSPAALGTEAGQDMASAAHSYATSPQPEIGELVAKAMPKPGTDLMAPGDVNSAPVIPDLQTPSQTTVFNQPIARGMANSETQMRDLVNEQWQQAGEAIGNTLKGLDDTGTKYDPTDLLKQVEGMYERDMNGKLMTSGVQGERNQAISDALESMKDYAQGQPIDWTDANRIKGMLQDSAKYAAKRFDDANEAYKTVASLIKEDIDSQAGKVLSQQGGDIADFQTLRNAYSKLSSLRSALNPAVGKEMLKPSFPEQVMSAGKRMAPYAVGGGVILKAVNSVLGGIH